MGSGVGGFASFFPIIEGASLFDEGQGGWGAARRGFEMSAPVRFRF
jgi:hypothetical protein